MNIDEISSHIEIQQAMYRYCRGVDRGDKELVRSVFHEDAYDDHGRFQGPAHKFSSMVVTLYSKCTLPAVHNVSNIYIELQGEVAAVESYVYAVGPFGEGDDEKLMVFNGRYLDRFERRDGKWLIAHRRVVVDWSRDYIPGPEWEDEHTFPRGCRGRSDPSYELFKG